LVHQLIVYPLLGLHIFTCRISRGMLSCRKRVTLRNKGHSRCCTGPPPTHTHAGQGFCVMNLTHQQLAATVILMKLGGVLGMFTG
jgi:hypothetical protein